MADVTVLWNMSFSPESDPLLFENAHETFLPPWASIPENVTYAARSICAMYYNEDRWDDRWSDHFGDGEFTAEVFVTILKPENIAGKYKVELERTVRTTKVEKVQK